MVVRHERDFCLHNLAGRTVINDSVDDREITLVKDTEKVM